MHLGVMRRAWLAVLIAGLATRIAVGAEATQTGQPETAARLTFANGRIRFVPPPGFTSLTAEEIAEKYPQSRLSHVAGNAQRTTTIGYELLGRAPSSDLEEARKFFAATFEKQLRNLKWMVNAVGRVGTRDWAQLEFTATDVADRPLHNIVLVSVYDGRILLFTFSSTATEFPAVERALRASIATIATTP